MEPAYNLTACKAIWQTLNDQRGENGSLAVDKATQISPNMFL
jgi:hypothetical protein